MRDVFREQRQSILRYLGQQHKSLKAFDEQQHPRDEHGRFASTGAGHVFGESAATVHFLSERQKPKTIDTLKHLLGKGSTAQDAASVSGATDDAVVKIELNDSDPATAEVGIIVRADGYEATRLIAIDGHGKRYLKANTFNVEKQYQGQGIFAPRVFGRMVEQGARLGLDRIVTTAERSPNANGYYTWARFGYDAPLRADHKGKLPESLRGAEKISDLMASEEGQQWWKTHGDTTEMTFDLKPGSKSRKIWEAYLEEKKATSPQTISQPPTEPGKQFSLTLKEEQEGGPIASIPWYFPSWDDFKLGAYAISQRMTPIISGIWDWAANRFAPRVGLDPDQWSVINPHTAHMIRDAAFNFCDSTNDSTSRQLDTALANLRQELTEGVVAQGEALPALTKRVNQIFDGLEKSKARAIAQTETSRAVHSAQEQAAIQSGVVVGWRWLASADACDVCLAIAARCPTVKLGQPFAVIGHNPSYKDVRFPPAHPHCNCTVEEILDTDILPTWYATLIQPGPATEDEIDELASAYNDQLNDIQRTWDPATGRYGKRMKPRPLTRKRRTAPLRTFRCNH